MFKNKKKSIMRRRMKTGVEQISRRNMMKRINTRSMEMMKKRKKLTIGECLKNKGKMKKKISITNTIRKIIMMENQSPLRIRVSQLLTIN